MTTTHKFPLQESRCSSDVECDEADTCIGRENGLFECEDACAGPVICGRNAVCTSKAHRDGNFLVVAIVKSCVNKPTGS